MFPAHIKSLRTLLDTFPTEESCLQYLELRRWNGNLTSPFVKDGLVYRCKNGKYMCAKTKKYFTVKTGTMFEKTKLNMRDWFIAIWGMLSTKKRVSSLRLADELGITQKSAWFMCMKIRTYFNLKSQIKANKIPARKLSGIIESDESFAGGKNKNRHKDKKVPLCQGRSFKDKTPVLGLLERNGELRCFVVADTKASSIKPIIYKHVEKGSVFISDEWMAYRGLDSDYDHHVVDHGKKQYVNPNNPEIHSNSIEGFWGIMKRGYNGIYNWWSRRYIQLYVDEFVFRFNSRKIKTIERFSLFLNNVFERITHQHIKDLKWN